MHHDDVKGDPRRQVRGRCDDGVHEQQQAADDGHGQICRHRPKHRLWRVLATGASGPPATTAELDADRSLAQQRQAARDGVGCVGRDLATAPTNVSISDSVLNQPTARPDQLTVWSQANNRENSPAQLIDRVADRPSVDVECQHCRLRTMQANAGNLQKRLAQTVDE